jgi:hypothetical protein
LATPDSDRLADELADAIADGQDVDWGSVERRSSDPRQRELIRNLQAISALAQSARREPSGGEATPLTRAGLPRMPRWRAAILWLAAAQVAFGLVAFALVPTGASPVPLLLPALSAVAFALAAGWLLFGGRDDARAANLAGVFLCLGASAALPIGILWAKLADRGEVPLLEALLPEAFMPVFLWAFVREFPRPYRLSAADRWMRLGERVTIGVSGTLFLGNLAGPLLLAQGAEVPDWLGWVARTRFASMYWVALFGSALPAFPLALLRARIASRAERRRFAFFLWGLAIGIGPMFLAVLLEILIEPYGRFMDRPGATFWGALVLYSLLISVPFTTAYSVVAHRVLEVRLLLRRAAVVALARRTLWIATAGPLFGLGAYLYANREERLSVLIETLQGELLMGAALVSLLLLVVREPLLAALDRLLFRDVVDWQGALSKTTSEIRLAATARQLEDSLAEHLDEAVRAGSVRLYLTSEDGLSFAPLGRGGRGLGTSTALARVVAAGESPVVTAPGDQHSVWPWLPAADREWLTESELGLIAPFVSSRGEVAGLIGLGPKQTAVPYSEDDLHFVAAVASSVALVMENQGLRAGRGAAGRAVGAETAFECRRCGAVSRHDAPACGCGGRWTEAQLPWRVNGKFELKRVLGRGGMGVVYLADDVDLGRLVALKTLPRLLPRAAKRLRNEARSMAALEHPNLAQIYGLESWRGVPVLVVEHLAGGTLARRMGRRWGWREALELGVQIGGALQAMHAKSLVHRDVKPSNIGFSAKQVPKLLDFGLAQIAAEAKEESDDYLAGTPLYVPPGGASAKGPASLQDLWGLALVVYELLAGRHPFRDRVGPADLKRGRLPAVPDLRELHPGCPEPVAALLAAALAARPEQRPSTAEELRARMEELLALSDI